MTIVRHAQNVEERLALVNCDVLVVGVKNDQHVNITWVWVGDGAFIVAGDGPVEDRRERIGAMRRDGS